MRVNLINGILPILVCFSACAPPAVRPTLDPERVTIKIDREVSVVEPSLDTGLTHEMLGLVRHPDGTIFLRTQTQGFLTSNDGGETWSGLSVDLPQAPEKQVLHGLGLSLDGRLWLMHQSRGGKDLFVSTSEDAALTWDTTSIDYANLAPGAPGRPYAFCYNDYNTFFQRPDGTMVLGVGLRYEDHGDYQQEDQSRPGFHETLIRSRDGGKTWGDPSEVHQHVAETGYALDPDDPDRILAVTRKQRPPLRGQDPAEQEKAAGVPPGTAWPWKGALLLESTDGGRSFQELPGSYLGSYSHRATILWTQDNTVVVASGVGRKDGRRVVRISLDGGRSWVDGSATGTPLLDQATPFVLLRPPPTISFTAPMIELSPNHFLTVYAHWEEESLKRYYEDPKSPCTQGNQPGNCPWLGIKALFWHLENGPETGPGA